MTPTPDPDKSQRYFVWHSQGECRVVFSIEEARELRDDYLDDGDFSTITNERNEDVR